MTAATLIARNDQIGAGRREAAAIAARLAQHPEVTFLEPGNVLLDNLAADIIEQPSEPACSHLFTVGRGGRQPVVALGWRSHDLLCWRCWSARPPVDRCHRCGEQDDLMRFVGSVGQVIIPWVGCQPCTLDVLR